ncbi:MAG: penicillin-binding transpeptidase domain-containing protein [Aggregatilineales bacterium]
MREGRLTPFQGPRLILTVAIMFTMFLVLVVRLYQYQFVQHAQFVAKANENAIQTVPLAAPRGVIYDRYGVPLALNSPAFVVTVTPASLPDDPNVALDVLNRLSALIDVPPTRAAADAAGKKDVRSLQEMVVEGQGIAPYRPVVVISDVPQDIAEQILQNKQQLPGVDVQWGAVRQYPTGALTSQLIGYLGPIGQAEADALRKQGYNPSFERTGYAGIEASMNDLLAGQRGNITQKIDVAGRPVSGGLISETPAVAGQNVRLTIDTQLQKGAQAALLNEINYLNSKSSTTVSDSGVVVALNPQTGEVLAMVSWPTYDNSKFARFIDGDYYTQLIKAPQFPLVNHAVGSLYPPGSTWKILTSTAVAQERVIAPDSNLNDPGYLIVKNSYAPNDTSSSQRFVCWLAKGHGEVNLIRAIAVSCDVYFYQVGGGNPAVSPQTLRPGGLGIDNLDRYAAMFGIGEQTFIEMPGAVAGRMPDPTWKRRIYGESWSTGDTYNAAFGQGYVTVSPLQLLNVAATIANGGTEYQPTVVNSVVDSEGNVLQPFQKHVMRTAALPMDGSPAVLHIEEDMRVKGQNSIACVCEADSAFYNDPNSASIRQQFGKQIQDPAHPDDPNAKVWVCDPTKVVSNYRATVLVDRDMTPMYDPATGKLDMNKHFNFVRVQYGIFVPSDYTFSDSICSDQEQFGVTNMTPAQFKAATPKLFVDTPSLTIGYQPPFVDPDMLKVIQTGMHEVTQAQYGGTAAPGFLTFGGSAFDYLGFNIPGNTIQTAGKTGTAEYCDQLAQSQNLCIPGSWPSHGWFIGYAPFDKPEISIVALIYHGGEGSVVAMPVVREVAICYFALKDYRTSHPGQTPPDCAIDPIDIPAAAYNKPAAQ